MVIGKREFAGCLNLLEARLVTRLKLLKFLEGRFALLPSMRENCVLNGIFISNLLELKGVAVDQVHDHITKLHCIRCMMIACVPTISARL